MKKFSDALNTAVFTTKFVILDKSPILNIFHDDDGDWQFIGPEVGVKNEDIKLVALFEIINIDNTVLEVADLPYDWEAHRDSIGSVWQRRKQISP